MYYIGLDVHKRTISYCVKDAAGHVHQEGPHAEKIKVAHPLMLRAIALAKKKNDKVDAAKIADCLRCDFLPECHMASTEIRDPRRMLRYRNLLVKQMVQMKNRVSGLLLETGVSYNKRRLHKVGYFADLISTNEEVNESIRPLLKLSDRLTKAKKPVLGIAELIWNSVDADATTVDVRLNRNVLGSLDSIEVIDNGLGITMADAQEGFGHLGGSWKQHDHQKKREKRILHGKHGALAEYKIVGNSKRQTPVHYHGRGAEHAGRCHTWRARSLHSKSDDDKRADSGPGPFVPTGLNHSSNAGCHISLGLARANKEPMITSEPPGPGRASA